MNESIDCLGKLNRTETMDTEPADEGAGPEQETSNTQLQDDLQIALMSIKPEYRTVVVLKHFLDCSYVEISEILNVPEKTVKSRLFTGRQLLKDVLLKSGTY
jgi:RNA polymerase sigma-70 factor (ECF subfamily)